MANSDKAPCACGSGRAYADCCGPVHAGIPAETAEALMRARYSAYARGDAAFLAASWHSRTRPPVLELAPPQPEWLGLVIRCRRAGGAGDTEGEVGFVARYRFQGETGEIAELSRFEREGGAWRYLDGAPLPARNAPCPCGSGRKFKRCCDAQ